MSTQTTRVRRYDRRWLAGAAATAMTAAAAISGVAVASAGSFGRPAATTVSTGIATTAPQTVRIARTQLEDTRAVLTATRARGGTATVRLAVLRRAGSGWRSLGTELVGERRAWFWNVVRGPTAICDFAVANTPRRSVDVRLLVSASIGCGTATRHFHVESGDLVPG